MWQVSLQAVNSCMGQNTWGLCTTLYFWQQHPQKWACGLCCPASCIYFHHHHTSFQVILPGLKWACSDINFHMEDCLLMLASHTKTLIIYDSCSEEVLILILLENYMAITTKISKLSLLLSQFHYDQNMQPFSRQTLILILHCFKPSITWTTFIHLGIWDYLLTSHLMHLQCYHWCSQLQAEFDVGSQEWFPISKPYMQCRKTVVCTGTVYVYIYTIGMETNYTIPVCTAVFLKTQKLKY